MFLIVLTLKGKKSYFLSGTQRVEVQGRVLLSGPDYALCPNGILKCGVLTHLFLSGGKKKQTFKL